MSQLDMKQRLSLEKRIKQKLNKNKENHDKLDKEFKKKWQGWSDKQAGAQAQCI